MKHREVVLGQLFIAGSYPPVLLKSIDAALHQVALPISLLVKRTSLALTFFSRNGVSLDAAGNAGAYGCCSFYRQPLA